MSRLILILIFIPLLCFSHSGRTDSRGGHNDNINGGYHYHHGCSAHSHSGGCPYDYENCRNGGSRSNYKSKSKNNIFKPLKDALYIIGGIFALIFIGVLLDKYEKYRVKQRKLKEERLEKDKRHKTYLFLKRKQHNQNDEYIPNQLTAEEDIRYNELKEEFAPKPKIEKPPEPISKKSKNPHLESLWFDLKDMIIYNWFLKNINNKYLKILLVILLWPVNVLLLMLFLYGFMWLFIHLLILITEGFQLIISYF